MSVSNENPVCEICRTEDAIMTVSFVGEAASSAVVCDSCRAGLCEQYRTMGKPGQIVIQPLTGHVRTFTHKSRCPLKDGGCGSLNTKALRTGKAKQYRVCLDCGKKYYEGGMLI